MSSYYHSTIYLVQSTHEALTPPLHSGIAPRDLARLQLPAPRPAREWLGGQPLPVNYPRRSAARDASSAAPRGDARALPVPGRLAGAVGTPLPAAVVSLLLKSPVARWRDGDVMRLWPKYGGHFLPVRPPGSRRCLARDAFSEGASFSEARRVGRATRTHESTPPRRFSCFI